MADTALPRSSGRSLGARTPSPSSRGSSVAVAAAPNDPALMWRRVMWLALAVAWLFVTISALTFNLADPPSPVVSPANNPVANLGGRVGAALAYYGYEMLGIGAWVLILLWGLHLTIMASGRRVGHLGVRFLGAVLMAGAIAAMQALLLPNSGPVRGLGGGLLGTVGTHELVGRFGGLGTFLVLSVVFFVGAVVALDAWAVLAALWAGKVVMRAGKPVARLAVTMGEAARQRVESAVAARLAGDDAPGVRLNDLDDDERVPGREGGAKRGRRVVEEEDPADEVLADTTIDEEDEEADDAEDSITVDEDEDAELDEREAAEQARAAKKGRARPAASEEGDGDDSEDELEEAEAQASKPANFDPEALRAKISRLPLRFASSTTRAATEEDLRDIQNVTELEGYQFPGLDLLENPETNYSEKMEAFVREQAEALERALKEYRIDGEVVGIESGPVITNYEIKLAPGTKVAALSAVSSDLARSLKAVNIRIVSNTAGRDTVGVEVPNAIKEKVRLKELMTKSETASKMTLPMFLGKDAAGEPLVADLAQMPHLLIAGTTGSGKSVCMNAVIMSFLYARKPNELKLVLVDPKMVELSQFKDIPHLMCPVVTDMAKAAAILEWAVGKMDERYELLAEAGCRDITSYNSLPWEELKERFNPSTPEEEARIPRKLPYMVFVIDELADLIITNKEVEQYIVRIAQKARAVGIHLIVATQRPQANVVTGLIKSNMPARICFKVASGMDSRIVLDQKGGELLLGQGDMLYLSPRSHKLTRAQGSLVDDSEIRRATKFMKTVATPTFERQLMQLRAPGAGGMSEEAMNDGFANAQEDPLFDKAVEVVLESKLGSVSMLQRRLAIGYTRAARLIEMMGEAGILGQHKGTVARDVLMSIEEWHALKAQAEADAAAAAASGEGSASGAVTVTMPAPARPSLADALEGRTGGGDAFDDSFKDDEGNDRFDSSGPRPYSPPASKTADSDDEII